MTTAQADQIYGAKWDIDSARGHLDTAACLLDDAIGHLEGARATRAQEILDHVTAVLTDLDRLREAL